MLRQILSAVAECAKTAWQALQQLHLQMCKECLAGGFSLAPVLASTVTSNVECLQAFIGGSPSFEAVDGSGIAIGQKVATTSATSTRAGDGGLGSVGDVLLSIVGQGTLRYAMSLQHIMSIGFFGHDQVHRISLQLQHVLTIAMICDR